MIITPGKIPSKATLLAAMRYFEFDGQPAFTVDGTTFGIHRTSEGPWNELPAADIQAKGLELSAAAWAALRQACAPDVGQQVCDSLNINVALEAAGLIAPPP